MEGLISLRVSAQELFQLFCEQLQQDVLTHCGQAISAAAIQPGFSYEKDLTLHERHPHIARVTLLAYDPCHSYTLFYESETTRATISYEIEEIGQHQIKVCYREVKYKAMKERNREVRFVPAASTTGALTFRKRRQFRALEKAILKNRLPTHPLPR